MSFDASASLRRLKPGKRVKPLRRRNDEELAFVTQADRAGLPLLLDTTVYIDTLQDRLPPEVAELLRVRQLNHSAVATAELSYLLGRLDPGHPGTADACKSIQTVIENIPVHRLQGPSIAAMAEAGILTGLIARLQGLQERNKQSVFNDAQLFLQALEQGNQLLTRNIGDMDYLQQIIPSGRVLFYRQSA